MKKFFFCAILAVLASCSSDDNEREVRNGGIAGKWYYVNTIVNGTVYPYDDHESCGKDYIEFFNDDEIRGIDVWDCEEELQFTGTFSITPSQLTIHNGFLSRTVDILEQSSSRLSYTYQYDRDNDGVEETIIENFER